MSIIFQCDHCGKKLRAKPDLAGKRIRCTGCKEIIRVAAESSRSPVKNNKRIHASTPPPVPHEYEPTRSHRNESSGTQSRVSRNGNSGVRVTRKLYTQPKKTINLRIIIGVAMGIITLVGLAVKHQWKEDQAELAKARILKHYANHSDQDLIRSLVHQYHSRCSDEASDLGGRGDRPKFDTEKYTDLMKMYIGQALTHDELRSEMDELREANARRMAESQQNRQQEIEDYQKQLERERREQLQQDARARKELENRLKGRY